MTKLCDASACVGCGACAQICPKNCFSMQLDKYGFWVPVVDRNVCVKCGLCQKACPALSPTYTLHEPHAVLCATLKNRPEVLKKSSSGGLAYALSHAIIKQGGVVFGAAYTPDMQVVHQEVTDLAGLSALQGSKYVQSHLNTTYQQAKKRLLEGKQVLFVGTPCQIAGLYTYLGNTPQGKLLTCDLLCGGAPAPGLFAKYIAYLEGKFKQKITCFNFRSKKYGYGYGYLHLLSTFNGRKPVLLTGKDSSFVRTLGLGYVRNSCFDCPFRSVQRVGDITAGDFWNLLVPVKQFEQGLSLGLVNTEKGHSFIKTHLAPVMQLKTCTLQDLKNSQNVSIRPTKKKPADYDEFFKQAKELSWPELTKRYIWPKSSFKHNLMDLLPPCVTSVLRRTILRVKLWRQQKAK